MGDGGVVVYQALKIALLCVLWYSFSAGNNILGKQILSEFPYPTTLSMVRHRFAGSHALCSSYYNADSICYHCVVLLCRLPTKCANFAPGTSDSSELFPGALPDATGGRVLPTPLQKILSSQNSPAGPGQGLCLHLLTHQHMESACILCTHR